MPGIIGVLLAGGRGQRMGGGDKPLRMLAGQSLMAHAIDRVAPQVAGLVLNANGDAARLAGFGLPIIADPLPDFLGPLAGILAGLRWAQVTHPGARDVLSVPTDTPFLPRDLVARLLAGRGAQPLACAVSAGWTHPVIGLWPVALADALETALRGGERKIGAFSARHGVAEIDFGTVPFDPFFNVNRPEDLAAAEEMIALYPQD
ncbi:MAG: molybdenum cofactor guanylyltransferase MobA [Acetobacteraceae bacterium]|nr:molybdenum cofactor guanylyltransferase MobA [Acetobacteraceae bacterium]